MTGALIRYLARGVLRGQRWLAPVLVFLLVVVPGTAVGGTALSCYGFTAAVLLPVTLWLTVAVANDEDPVQTSITVVTVGSSLAVRLAKLVVAGLIAAVLGVFAVVWPLITAHPADTADVLAGLAGQLLCLLAGVALGAVLVRPLVRRPAWVVLGGTALCLVEILVPGFPPVRPVATLLSADPGTRSALWSGLGLAGIETLGLVAVLIGAGHWLALQRE
jgi:hypothetical protein